MDSGGGTSDKVFLEMPPCSSAQEAPRRRWRRSKTALRRSSALFRRRSRARSRLEVDAGVSVWAGLHPDILGVVLRLLPRLVDRASVRSVCRHWRAVGRSQALPPPLPLLVLPEFKFSSLSAGRELTPARRISVPKEVGTDDLCCVGSCEGWLVALCLNRNRWGELYGGCGDCFLVKAFSPEVVKLPVLSSDGNLSARTYKILPVINGFDQAVSFETNGEYTLLPRKVVLSSSPDSGSKYIVAAWAVSDHMEHYPRVALWQPGMTSWHICQGDIMDEPTDLAFYQGKLYVLQRSKPRLFAFELEEDDHGIIVSRVKRCVTELRFPHPMQLGIVGGSMSCNIVVWCALLLLIVRYYGDYYPRRNICAVKVYALDFSRNPYGVTEIRNLGGDCIFVGSGGCESFPASLHDTVEGDQLYFVPDNWNPYDRFVYNMRNGRMKLFAVKLPPFDFDVPGEINDFPVWLFPLDAAAPEQT